jgi:branched-chain amino acid transport system substrate-binding protein
MLRLVVLLNAVLLACGSLAQPSRAAETIKIALIDPLSGPTANLGNQALKHFRFVADRINRSGGVNGRNLEIVPFDNEGNPERTLILLKLAIDKGVRYISQGSSTPVGYAISDAVSKYNSRNPDKPVLFLDWGDLDTGLTEDHCSFWHFRFDANVAMRTKALTDYIASLPM